MPTKLLIGNYPVFFIIWNLFLLLVPYFLYLALSALESRTRLKSIFYKLIALFIAVLWLLFIPNTAYVMVDVRHISTFCNELVYKNCIDNVWQILFFFTYGLIGWLGYVYIIRKMKGLLSKIYSSSVGNIFNIIIIPLISLGVLLGLVERWNSWEVLNMPLNIIQDALHYFTNIYYFQNYLLFTLFLYILYYLGESVYQKLVNSKEIH